MTLTPTTAEVVETANALSGFLINKRWVLLPIYGVILLIFSVISIYALSRMWHLRVKGDYTGMLIVVYLIFVAILLVGTIFFALTIDWSGKIY